VTLQDDVPAKASWPFVRTMVERDVVLSTSDVAAQLVRSVTVALPLAVWAHWQTRGRGRGSHEWWSDAGSLTFTIAIDPPAHGLGQMALPRVALATAVAVIDAIGELGFGELSLGIRWPNDLECGGKKLGGILPEVVNLADGERLLIGVGLNVQTKLEAAPEEVRAMATSLEAVWSGAIAKDLSPRLLAAILRRFEAILGRLASADAALAGRWNELDVLRGRRVRVDVGSHVVEGRGCGIDALGALCLDDGRVMDRIFGGTVLR
jgi:BirA family transcriptional regulator, biotin operon repressor / biotin---[acetyl-CoA-carboxylase] ligase